MLWVPQPHRPPTRTARKTSPLSTTSRRRSRSERHVKSFTATTLPVSEEFSVYICPYMKFGRAFSRIFFVDCRYKSRESRVLPITVSTDFESLHGLAAPAKTNNTSDQLLTSQNMPIASALYAIATVLFLTACSALPSVSESVHRLVTWDGHSLCRQLYFARFNSTRTNADDLRGPRFMHVSVFRKEH